MLLRIYKYLMRVVTRKGELERAILLRSTAAQERGGLSANVVKRVAKSLARSSQLAEVKDVVFGGRPFSVSDVLETIIRVKGLRDQDKNVINALRWCLQASKRKTRGSRESERDRPFFVRES